VKAKRNENCLQCDYNSPALLEQNQTAFHLWQLCNTQFRQGVNGLTGLDYMAVKQISKIYDIELSPGVMTKIRALESEILRKVQEGRKQYGE
jgi:hypothetical protein